MTRMTRTQISLNEDEHRYLKLEAARVGVSLSAFLRGIVREKMDASGQWKATVAEIVGLLADADAAGRDHDAILYGTDRAARDGD
jgi:hypothetical protein